MEKIDEFEKNKIKKIAKTTEESRKAQLNRFEEYITKECSKEIAESIKTSKVELARVLCNYHRYKLKPEK